MTSQWHRICVTLFFPALLLYKMLSQVVRLKLVLKGLNQGYKIVRSQGVSWGVICKCYRLYMSVQNRIKNFLLFKSSIHFALLTLDTVGKKKFSPLCFQGWKSHKTDLGLCIIFELHAELGCLNLRYCDAISRSNSELYGKQMNSRCQLHTAWQCAKETN